jgi:hypothetical protein
MRIRIRDVIQRYTQRRTYRPSTVRYMFPLIAATFGLLGATYLSGSGSYVVLTPTPAYVQSGDIVEVKVEAIAAAPVNTVDIKVSFPDHALKPFAVEKGGSVITLWTNEPSIDGTTVTLRGGVYRKGFIGRHTIATVRAKAVAEGNADVLVAREHRSLSIQIQTQNWQFRLVPTEQKKAYLVAPHSRAVLQCRFTPMSTVIKMSILKISKCL